MLRDAALRAAVLPAAVLAAAGACWGLTMPLLRIAASAGYPPLALLLWSNALLAVLAGLVLVATGRPWPRIRDNGPALLAISVFGTALPGYFSFVSAAELPAGVRAIVIAMVPIFALPMAIVLGAERFELRRSLGLVLGLAAVGALALPGASGGATGGATGGPIPPVYVLIAALSPLCYAVEANMLSARAADLDPIGLLFAAGLLSVALTAPFALAFDAFVLPRSLGAAELALAAAAPVNLCAYVAYVWLTGHGGAVFAAQVGYVVTVAGVLWGMILLGERPGPAVWLALALMLAGIALVRPREAHAKDA